MTEEDAQVASEPAAELAGVPRRILRTAVAANATGAVLVYLYLQFLAPGAYNPHASQTDGIVSLVVMAIYLPLSVAVVVRVMRPYIEQAAVLADGQLATDEQRRRVLGVPARVAWLTGTGWVGAAVVFGILNGAAFGNPAVSVVRVTVGIALGGLVTAALTATLAERLMRPVLAQVLAGDPGGVRGMASLAIRARLLRAWVLGSAVPLLAIGLTPLARTAHDRSSLVVPIAFLAGLGLVAGIVISTTTASAVSEPLKALRRAVDSVRDGDLNVSVPVDDAGEIGMLEAGVNHMVAGLRQRRRLEDLFGRHVGEEVARRALEEEEALGGAQRQVSILFVDLIGSTALSATRPADEVVRVLNMMFGCVVQSVTDEGGWVNKFEGDGAMCVFGAPTDQPDHAARALRAARRLRQMLDEAHGAEAALDAAIGVATGTAVAGNVGALDRYEYTVIGDPVNEAARLSDLAKTRPGRLIVSRTTTEAAGTDEARLWVEAGSEVLRGRTAPSELMTPDPAGQKDGAGHNEKAGQPPATAGTMDRV